MTDFEKIVRLFSEAGIDCVIVGGLAATIHGSARLTQDVDFVYARDRANIGRLVAALKPYSPYLRGAPPSGRPPACRSSGVRPRSSGDSTSR